MNHLYHGHGTSLIFDDNHYNAGFGIDFLTRYARRAADRRDFSAARPSPVPDRAFVIPGTLLDIRDVFDDQLGALHTPEFIDIETIDQLC